MRELASIQKILSIDTIPGKDRIVLATILGWHVIVQKDAFNVGDLCVYCEIDSILPASNPAFEFMSKYNYRVKTLKMGGVISQGIAFPLSVLPPRELEYTEGEDVTDILGIKKYEPETEAAPIERSSKKKSFWEKLWLMRFGWYRRLVQGKSLPVGFPTQYVNKTDETRIQSIPWVLTENVGQPWVLTEKVDGTSGTFLLVKKGRKKEYYVCSRNRRIPVKDDSIYWAVSDKYHIEEALESIAKRTGQEWCCMQGECIGPKVQRNKYKVTEPKMYAFNLICGERGLIPSYDAKELLASYDIPFVPIVGMAEVLPKTVDEMVERAHGFSKLLSTTLREGLVCRTWDARRSFKVIDPQFLLKWGE